MKIKFILFALLFLWSENAVPQVIAVNDTLYIGENDTVPVNLLKNDTGVNLTISSLNLQGTLGWVNINEGDTAVSYGSPFGYNGTDSFQYTAVSNSGDSASGEVFVNVMRGLSSDYFTIALYKFEEEQPGQSFDYSYNENHGIDFGTQVTAGVLGNSRYLDGIDDYINMDSARSALHASSEWTIEFVAKAVSDTIVPPGLINHSCGNGWVLIPQRAGITYGIKTNSAGACFWIGNNWQYTPTEKLDTLWHYYAATFTSNDSLRIYKDGNQVASQYVSGLFQLTQGNNFTANIGINDFGGVYYEGYVDEVRVSSIARTPENIRATFDLLNDYLGLPTNISEEEKVTPDGFQLSQNYPNPFNPTTNFEFRIADFGFVTLKVYDVLGNEIATLVNEEKDRGVYTVNFDATGLASGVYFYRIQAGSFNQVKKMILLR